MEVSARNTEWSSHRDAPHCHRAVSPAINQQVEPRLAATQRGFVYWHSVPGDGWQVGSLLELTLPGNSRKNPQLSLRRGVRAGGDEDCPAKNSEFLAKEVRMSQATAAPEEMNVYQNAEARFE